ARDASPKRVDTCTWPAPLPGSASRRWLSVGTARLPKHRPPPPLRLRQNALDRSTSRRAGTLSPVRDGLDLSDEIPLQRPFQRGRAATAPHPPVAALPDPPDRLGHSRGTVAGRAPATSPAVRVRCLSVPAFGQRPPRASASCDTTRCDSPPPSVADFPPRH